MSSLFGDLPPPSAPQAAPSPPPPPLPPAAPSILKTKGSALKRPAAESEGKPAKQVRFGTPSVETSNEKVIEAIEKLSTYIGNAEKFPKASKLAMQLLAGSSMPSDVSNPFFDMLAVAMSPPSNANGASVRAHYSALFSAVNEKLGCFTPAQQAKINVWLVWAELANEFHTDDTFMLPDAFFINLRTLEFSKAAGRLKQAIESLPDAGENDEPKREEVDPFGLDALLPGGATKKIVEATSSEELQLLQERREALVQCLSIAVSRYKQKWAQTIIDIAAKHAVDHRQKFNALQQRAVEKLWSSVKEQLIKRRQGKNTTGKLDETSFEKYREEYSHKKISIRKAVGSGGERGSEQWLG